MPQRRRKVAKGATEILAKHISDDMLLTQHGVINIPHPNIDFESQAPSVCACYILACVGACVRACVCLDASHTLRFLQVNMDNHSLEFKGTKLMIKGDRIEVETVALFRRPPTNGGRERLPIHVKGSVSMDEWRRATSLYSEDSEHDSNPPRHNDEGEDDNGISPMSTIGRQSGPRV